TRTQRAGHLRRLCGGAGRRSGLLGHHQHDPRAERGRQPMTDFETILVDTRGKVGWITLNRPDALNALNTQVMHEVVVAASAFDAEEGIGAIVVTGSERAF